MSDLSFSDFRKLASDLSLSSHERIGFPDAYREGFEPLIFADVVEKLPALLTRQSVVVDIGPGCSGLPRLLIDHCTARQQELVLIDSAEMLAQLPDTAATRKIAGRFPDDCADILERYAQGADAVLVYSVLQHVAVDGDVVHFVDACASLLRDGGRLLIGDIPNRSKRSRFFASAAGVRFHQQYTGSLEPPGADVIAGSGCPIDDGRMLELLTRCRSRGFDAYVVPQPLDLPMANRREDLLVCRP